MQSFLESSKDFERRVDSFSKITFLSYYMPLYVSTVSHNSKYQYISVNKLYNFIQDLHSKIACEVLSITKRVVSYCFSILNKTCGSTCLK